MRITKTTHPALWELFKDHNPIRHILGYLVKPEEYEKYRAEADEVCPHLSPLGRDAWAAYNAIHHPGFGEKKPVASRGHEYWIIWAWRIALFAGILFLVAKAAHGQGAASTASLPAVATSAAPTYNANQRVALSVDLSGNLRTSGGGGGGGTSLADQGTFTQGTTAFTPAGCEFNTSIANLISGTAGAFQCTNDRMIFINLAKLGGTVLSGANVVDAANTAFRVNCVTGCVAGGSFTDNTAFTAGTTSESNIGGVFNDTITSLTSGNAGAVRLTTDRMMFTNLGKVGGAAIALGQNTMANSLPVAIASNQSNLGVTQQTSPWVDNITQFGGTNISTGTGAGGLGIPRVTVSNDSSILGTKTNNNTAPGATNFGVLPCLANAANPSWTEGNQVDCSVDLSGNNRELMNSWFGSTAPTVGSKTSANSIPVVPASDFVDTTTGNKSDNGAAAGTNRVNDNPGIYQTDYRNGTAGTQGNDAAVEVGTDGLTWTAQLPAIRPASYHASASYAGSSTTFAAHLAGNATNTVLVTKVMFSCTQTTAGTVTVTVNKTSAASAGGTAATMTTVPDDSNYAAASSVAQSFTGTGPTPGTLVGQIDAYKLGCIATSTATPNDIYILNLRQKPIVLRGTAQTLEIGVGAATTGGNYTTTWEWIETKTIAP